MSSSFSDARAVATAVARRNLTHAFKNPALLVPSLVFPLVFLLAFAGGLSSLQHVPGFDFPSGYTAFQFVFVFLQSAAFGGVFTGLAIAGDFESGFTQRLLLGAPRRTGLILGYVVAGMARWLVTSAVVTIAALAAGMQVDGDGVQLVGLLLLGLSVNVAATLFATGMSMRLRSMQAGPLMQIPIFVTLFLAPVYVPKDLLRGWVHTAASLNPATALLEAGRGFISGEPDVVAVAFACGAGLVAVMAVFAVRGLRRAEREA
jgi:ABC-2 type transport system permease protein